MREIKLDALRGFAIILVVVGHVTQFHDLVNYRSNLLFKIIYSFHMPLFFFISGRVSSLYGTDGPSLTSYIGKVKNLALPWIIWTAAFWELGGYVIDGVTQQYWFLPILVSCFTVLYLKQLFSLVMPAKLAIVCLVCMWLVSFSIDGFWISSMRYHLIFFVAGFIFTKQNDLIERVTRFSFARYLVYALAAIALVVISDIFPLEHNKPKVVIFLFRCAIAIILIVSAWCLVGSAPMKIKLFLAFFGVYSIQIYLIHLMLIPFVGIGDAPIDQLLVVLSLLATSLLVAKLVNLSRTTNRIIFGR